MARAVVNTKEVASSDKDYAWFEFRSRLPVRGSAQFYTSHPFQAKCVCGVRNQVYPSSVSRNSSFAGSALWPPEIAWRYNARDMREDIDRDANRIEAN